PEQSSSIKLRVSADVVVRVRMQLGSVAIVPDFFGVILRLEIHRGGAPVVLLARNIVAALQNKNLLPRRCELRRERSAARPRADYDDVVMAHDSSPSLI